MSVIGAKADLSATYLERLGVAKPGHSSVILTAWILRSLVVSLPGDRSRAGRGFGAQLREQTAECRRLKIIPNAFGEKAVFEAHVCRHDPGRRALAGDQDHPLRTPSDGGSHTGVGSGI